MPHPLTESELTRLETLLNEAPQPLEALDCVSLEGYLCGVLVQPERLEPAQWLRYALDTEGRPLPDDLDPAWLAEVSRLIERHHDALRASFVEHGAFDPLLPEEALDAPEEDPDLPEASRLLWPWVAGFAHAMEQFPMLAEMTEDEIDDTLDRIYRHLPATTDDERALRDELNQSRTMASVDAAIGELVLSIVDLSERTEPLRYHVATHKREAPKVGRNDPCPCGSGRKYKACHGAG